MNFFTWMIRSAQSGGPIPQHDARFDQSGAWPAATQEWDNRRMRPALPAAAPPGWYAGNVPAAGEWIPISALFLGKRQENTLVQQPQIGPYDESEARGNALQAALARDYAALTQQRQG